MNKERFGFLTLSRLLGKKTKEKRNEKNNDIASQHVLMGNKGLQQHEQQQQNQQQSQQENINNIPFEQTFRVTVLLPHGQLYVARLGARTKLKHLRELVCENKLLDKEQFEFRDPIDSSQYFDLESTIGSVGLSELRLCHKNETRNKKLVSAPDTAKVKNQISPATERNYATNFVPNCENSVKTNTKISLNDSTISLNSVNSSKIDVTAQKPYITEAQKSVTMTMIPTLEFNKIPVAPIRKKRLAPRPPSQTSQLEIQNLSPTSSTDQSCNSDVNQNFIDSYSKANLQKNQFYSSTPNLNTNRNSNSKNNVYIYSDIYDDINLHESNGSFQSNDNKNKNKFTENNNDLNYKANDISKFYFGNVQNYDNTPTNEPYNSGSFISLDHHQFHIDREFPKPSPRKILSIKKRTSAPPPPPKTILTSSISQPVAAPREVISHINIEEENKTSDYFEISENNEYIDVQSALSQNDKNGKVENISTSGEISQKKFLLKEDPQSIINGIKEKDHPILTKQSEQVIDPIFALKSETKNESDEELLTSPKPSENFDNFTEIPKIVIDRAKEHQDQIDSIMESFREIESIHNEASGVDDKLHIEEAFEKNIETLQITEDAAVINSDIEDGYQGNTILETDNTAECERTVDKEVLEKSESEKPEEIPNIEKQNDSENVAKELSSKEKYFLYKLNKIYTIDYDKNVTTPEVITYEELSIKEKPDMTKIETKVTIKTDQQGTSIIPEKQESSNTPEKQESSIIPKKQESSIIPEKQDSPIIREKQDSPIIPERQESSIIPEKQEKSIILEEPVETKLNDKLYENSVTVKLSNSTKFRKSIGRADSFHTTQNHPSSEFRWSNPNYSSNSKSQSFLSLLAAQRKENSSQNLHFETPKLENCKATSDLRITELPNLQSLIVIKSILSPQKNLNKLNDNKNNNINNDKNNNNNNNNANNINNYDNNNNNNNNDNNNNKMDDDNIAAILQTAIAPHKFDNKFMQNKEIPKNYSTLQEDEDLNTTNTSASISLKENNTKWKYQGKPNIDLSTWNERPKYFNDVTIKNEGDYIFGGATARKFSSISAIPKKDSSLYSTAPKTETQMMNYASNYRTAPDYKLSSFIDKSAASTSILPLSLPSDDIKYNKSKIQKSPYSNFRNASSNNQNENIYKLYVNHNLLTSKEIYNKINNDKKSQSTTHNIEHKNDNFEKLNEEKSKEFISSVNSKSNELKQNLIVKPSTSKMMNTDPSNGENLFLKRLNDIRNSIDMPINEEKKLYDYKKNLSNGGGTIPKIPKKFYSDIDEKNSVNLWTTNNNNKIPMKSFKEENSLIKPKIKARTNITKPSNASNDVKNIHETKTNVLAEIRNFKKDNLKRI